MSHLKMSKLARLNVGSDLLVGKFFYFATTGANQMMMGVVAKRFFVLSMLTRELMFDDQFGI
jgi:hypothetical protein